MKYSKNLDFSYITCCPSFSQACGIPQDSIKGARDSDMPWGRNGGTICQTTDQMTLEKGAVEVLEIIHINTEWLAINVSQKIVDGIIVGEAVPVENLLEIKILNTFSPETRLVTPYGNEPLTMDDIMLIEALLFNWPDKKFESVFNINRRGKLRRQGRLLKRFNVDSFFLLIERLSQLRVMSALIALKSHKYI